jgi:hypothetical protein
MLARLNMHANARLPGREGWGVIVSPFSRFFVRYQMSTRSSRNRGMPLNFLSADDSIDVVSALNSAINANRAEIILSKSDVVRLTKLEIREQEGLAARQCAGEDNFLR